ncbi:glycosyltransferase family 2 protein [Bacillus sp. FJAT-27245]|uniref:glycosyltransferase family 2 protein n=1 Tax=Bacillus sp. FJAT-27245 TaxID=1684144 RepID=UPI0006A7C8C6|nr:glycosyltransferase family 2 protein [Bacillus sp. FJAT-27245]
MGNNSTKFSIITPSFNQGEFIEQTIKSVINQSYKNFEYIIVDGGSTDNTHEILKKYLDHPKIKIIVEKDDGQSDAINKGFKIATGHLVGWINSDDLLEKDSFKKISNEYQKNPNAAIFYGDLKIINGNGIKIGCIKSDNIDYYSLLNIKPDVTQPGSFYNGSFLKEIGFLDKSIHFTMDYDLWLRLLKKGNAIKINSILASFRFQQNSKTIQRGNALKFWKDIFYIRKKKHSPYISNRLFLYFLKWCFQSILRKFHLIRGL